MPNNTERRRIAGRPGTQPQPATVTPAPVTPPPEAERTASIEAQDGAFYVVSGNLRIRLDDTAAARLRGAGGPAAPLPQTRRETQRMPSELERAVAAANANADKLKQIPGVVSVRAGYKFIDGKITDIPCVVVAVEQKPKGGDPSELMSPWPTIPPVLEDGTPTDITQADPYEMLAAHGTATESPPAVPGPRLLIDELQQGSGAESFTEAVPVTTYQPPPDGNLDPVTGAMTVICHVSPDAGWRTLRAFLAATERKLHLGMYDFTAPHIYKAARSLLRNPEVEWQQVLGPGESLAAPGDVDSTKANDKSEADIVKGLRRLAGARFRNAFARVGAGQTFASAYHIKVAVRDDKALWLSSGNWQSSNQPAEFDLLEADSDRGEIPRYNREWHLVIENATLAKRFQRFLDYDFETAASAPEAATLEAAPAPDLLVDVEEFFAEESASDDLEVFAPQKFVFTSRNPLTVTPILTPDNYLEVVLDFLRRKPRGRLYFQNQSLNPVKDPTPEYAELLRLLAEYSQNRDLDVRIIFRNIGPTRKKLESLKAAGFNMSRIKIQTGCHTKGIIVDSEAVLLGSHNVTNQGVTVNRDASLLIRHEGIARYFERVFLHDWEKLSRFGVRDEAMPVPAAARRGSEAAEMGAPGDREYLAVPWSYFEEE
jgi:hypothetical protein